MKDTDHWHLDMWQVVDSLKPWIESKKKSWRKNVFLETLNTVIPSFMFSNKFEDVFKSSKEELPKHKSRYAPGKMIEVQFENLTDLEAGKKLLESKEIEITLNKAWAIDR